MGSYSGGSVLDRGIRWSNNIYYGVEGTVTAITQGEGVLSLAPMQFPANLRLTGLAFEITVVGTAGALFRAGIYEQLGSNSAFTLLQDFGTFDGTVLGVVESPINVTARPTSWVGWIGGVIQGGAGTRPTLRTFIPQSGIISSFQNASAATAVAQNPSGSYALTGVAGALPSSIPIGPADTNGNIFKILFRGTQG